MKTNYLLIAFLAGTVGVPSLRADSTITTGAQHGYGANIGWTDWKWDPATPEGVSVGTYVLRGKIYSANVGWIDVGDGAPDDGIYYSLTGGDWGVNHDGSGGLMGFAYGANIGWISFSQSWKSPPRIDLTTGALSGYAYGANVGWINLDGIESVIECSPDTDGDGIEDSWEYEQLAADGQTADLTVLGAGDSDGDGTSDLAEFYADTNPFDHLDEFSLTMVDADPATGDVEISWPASARRVYDARSSTTLAAGSWSLLSSGILGGSYTHATGTLPTRTFYRVDARIPLKP